ncbi:hypothetical protein AB0D99_02600, partial [Streptomyces sp. NPDC047971]|uniref:hypothetical protein n=1 Tax=Streptomyces sp. NPDC047971 TaxID=3154499 RepID=UPI003409B2BB
WTATQAEKASAGSLWLGLGIVLSLLGFIVVGLLSEPMSRGAGGVRPPRRTRGPPPRPPPGVRPRRGPGKPLYGRENDEGPGDHVSGPFLRPRTGYGS